VEWTFDEMFSAQVIAEADVNKDKKLDESEIDYVYNNAFINLENYGYFFYQRSGQERIPAETVQKLAPVSREINYFTVLGANRKQKQPPNRLFD
jgi:ABC-type uncharacterized transport system substrate-binding protein